MTATHRVFSEAQRELLTAVLNRIIPAEVGAYGRTPLPGAGDLGLVDFIEGVVGRNNQLRRLSIEGLAQIEITAARREGKEFRELAETARDGALRQAQGEQPRFFEVLVTQTYNGYYINPRIFQLIGYTLPQAYEPKPFDESLLGKQRQRAPFWRQV